MLIWAYKIFDKNKENYPVGILKKFPTDSNYAGM